jgi:hypothetical protein
MEFAEQLADRCEPEVSRRLAGLSSGMSTAEARGYIRTRAAVVINRQVNLMLRRESSLRQSDRVELIEFTTDLVVEQFLNQMPEPHRERFAA